MTGDKAAVPAVDSTTNALHALTPKYDEKQHAIYLAALDATLSNKDIKNIALTGGYGTGKSSILRKFADENRKRVIEISLSTLGFDGSTDDDVETSLIQKEIVKQLLYRLAPHRSVGSRFQRIGRFRFGPAAGVAAGLGLAITFVSLFAGWTQKLSNLVNAGAAAFGAISFDIGLWIQPIVWGVYSLAVLALVAAFHNRIQIPRVKAGDFEVTLSRDGTSYFDKYLDEIVYYFENDKKRDIVVLEDIDRFDNPHIFETLRALNTLLNAASQLRPRVIRFVYAMKDSIFIDLGRSDPEEDSEYGDASPDEAAQANRTKFFDLVIPVVPFITHANARNLIDTELGVLKDELDPRVIDIAARHITDMRLIKNVRNEYVIFKQKVLISDEGKQLDLSKSALFAMMLYKGIHLEDFEKIKPGDSRLDDLYREYRQIVNFTRQRLTAEIQQARRELRDLSTVDGRGARAGVALQSYIAGVRRQLAAPDRPPTTISLNGVDRTPDIETSGF